MRRREFITLLSGVAAGWPLAAHTQQNSALRTVGFLTSLTTGDAAAPMVTAFVRGLNESGFTEGRNVTIEYPIC